MKPDDETPLLIDTTAPDRWEVEVCESREPGVSNLPKIIVKLKHGKRTFHTLHGPTARRTMQEFADALNAKGVPAPPLPVKTVADGYSVPGSGGRVKGG